MHARVLGKFLFCKQIPFTNPQRLKENSYSKEVVFYFSNIQKGDKLCLGIYL